MLKMNNSKIYVPYGTYIKNGFGVYICTFENSKQYLDNVSNEYIVEMDRSSDYYILLYNINDYPIDVFIAVSGIDTRDIRLDSNRNSRLDRYLINGKYFHFDVTNEKYSHGYINILFHRELDTKENKSIKQNPFSQKDIEFDYKNQIEFKIQFKRKSISKL